MLCCSVSDKMSKSNNFFRFTTSEKVCFKIFEIVGVQNFSLNQLNDDKLKFSIFRFCWIFMKIVGILVITKISSELFEDEDVADIKTNPMLKLLETGMLALLLFTIIINIFKTYSATNDIKQIYLNFKKSHNLIPNKLPHITIEEMKKSKINFLIKFIFIIFLVILLHFNNIYESKNVLILFLSGLPTFMVYLASFQVIFMIDLINQNLKMIKNLIEGIVENYKVTKRILIIIPRKPIEYQTMQMLRVCRQMYNLMQETCMIINDVYGFFIIAEISACILYSTYGGYLLFGTLAGGKYRDIYLLTSLYLFFISQSLRI
jgi:hypothetical protein